jgi:hypothetical protein
MGGHARACPTIQVQAQRLATAGEIVESYEQSREGTSKEGLAKAESTLERGWDQKHGSEPGALEKSCL